MITGTHKGKYYDVEYSIVNVSELEEDLRIGAETYHPEKIEMLSFLNSKADGTTIGTHFHPVKELFDPKKSLPKKVRLLELENMGNFEIFDIPEVSSTEFDSTKNIAKFGDVVISKLRPYLRQVGFIYLPEVYTTTELLILRQKNKKPEDLNYYLYAFLMTKWVQKILFWSQEGVNHPRFPKYILLNCPMPKPSPEFIFMIKQIIENYFKLKQKAKQLYKQAEEILLEELELKNWKPKTKKIKIGGKEFEEEENISIRMLSEVIKADRMDAEYWEPKYDELEEKIKAFRYEKLYKLASNSYETFNPKGCNYFYYLEIANVDLVTGDYEIKKIPCTSAPSRAKKIVEEKDILISTVRPNRNAVAFVIKKNKEPFVASTGFCKLKVMDEKILPEYLFVLFKTDLYKELLVRKTTATMYPAVSENDIMQLDIPLLPIDIQKRIKDIIMIGFLSRENSKKLLEIARRTVEIYIEKDEEEGLEYARNKLKELSIEI